MIQKRVNLIIYDSAYMQIFLQIYINIYLQGEGKHKPVKEPMIM